MLHDHLCSFEQVDVATSVLRLEQTAHLFGLTREWEAGQDIKSLYIALNVLKDARGTLPSNKLHLDLVAELNKSDLVWATGLELRLWLFVDDRARVAPDHGASIERIGERAIFTQVADVELSFLIVNKVSDNCLLDRSHIVA